jgi:hypothetical protein
MEVIVRQDEQGRDLLDAKTEVVALNAEIDGVVISIAT